jgi:NADPH:quinone reductase-like Zn-dependent oxidoreductase
LPGFRLALARPPAAPAAVAAQALALVSSPMFAVTAARFDAENPLAGLELGEHAEPVAPDGWTTVRVRAAALNHHDVWSLRGVGLSADRLPMILGCDAAGLDEDGREVVVHAVIGDALAAGGDETLDPSRSLLSERHQGTFAELVTVPRRNLVPKPAALSFEQAACMPTAYLTAFRMLFDRAPIGPGATVLVQGAGGGVATALIQLGRAAGLRMWATSRSEAKRARALELGADQAFETGARLPERVDAVMETVGEATWAHSLRSLKPGGTIVICGATSGSAPPADLSRVFFLQLSVVGSTMGTRDELARLLTFCEQTGVRPVIDRTMPLAEARDGFAAMVGGDLFGKVVFTA